MSGAPARRYGAVAQVCGTRCFRNAQSAAESRRMPLLLGRCAAPLRWHVNCSDRIGYATRAAEAVAGESMKGRQDVAVAIVGTMLGLGALIAIPVEIPGQSYAAIENVQSPAFFPILISLLLIGLGLLLLASTAAQPDEARSPSGLRSDEIGPVEAPGRLARDRDLPHRLLRRADLIGMVTASVVLDRRARAHPGLPPLRRARHDLPGAADRHLSSPSRRACSSCCPPDGSFDAGRSRARHRQLLQHHQHRHRAAGVDRRDRRRRDPRPDGDDDDRRAVALHLLHEHRRSPCPFCSASTRARSTAARSPPS